MKPAWEADFAALAGAGQPVGAADLSLWARTALPGERAAYPAEREALDSARALAQDGLVLLFTRREGGDLRRLMVRR